MAGYVESPEMPLPRHKAILKGLETLAEAHLQNPVLSRLCQPKMLPQRLRDRWQSLGFQDHAPTEVPTNSVEDRRRQRLEAMRQRQQAMMQRMQQKQKDAVATLAVEGEAYEDSVAEDANLWQCATCREVGSPEKPLAMLAAVQEFRGRSGHLNGHPGFQRFTSCRHMLHVACGQRHAPQPNEANVLAHMQSSFDPDRGEFACPMCRSVANCFVPCVPDQDIFEAPSSWAEASVAKVKTLPWLQSHVEKCGKKALGKKADANASGGQGGANAGALALLRSACAELVTSATLAPQALADEGPPPPLFAVLLQDAAVLRYETEPVPQTTEENWQGKIFQRLAKPHQPWLSDLRAALAELVLASLKEGLSPRSFSEYVMLLLQVQTCQAQNALAAGEGAEEEPHIFVLKQQMNFLIFASWLATAIWRFSSQERNRLAYLELSSEGSLMQLTHLLRLPGLAAEQVPHGLPASLQVFSKGELAEVSMESFIELPENYLDLLQEVRKRSCSKCQSAPDEPALCLLCGAIVCVGNQACRGGDQEAGEGPCTSHARTCTAGQSLFLLPYLAMILAVSAPDCCLWDCPYVDKNGEPNPRMKRPCAMNFRLDARRWENLRQIFVKSTVRREIFLYNEKMGQYIPEAL